MAPSRAEPPRGLLWEEPPSCSAPPPPSLPPSARDDSASSGSAKGSKRRLLRSKPVFLAAALGRKTFPESRSHGFPFLRPDRYSRKEREFVRVRAACMEGSSSWPPSIPEGWSNGAEACREGGSRPNAAGRPAREKPLGHAPATITKLIKSQKPRYPVRKGLPSPKRGPEPSSGSNRGKRASCLVISHALLPAGLGSGAGPEGCVFRPPVP